MRSFAVAYWNAHRPLSQFHSSLTAGSAPARRRRTLPRRQSVRCWQPDAQCSQTLGVETRSKGHARKRYCAPVRAPTGQICTVLPEKEERVGGGGGGGGGGGVGGLGEHPAPPPGAPALEQLDERVTGDLLRE